jgi:aerobic-type carbon monoxide dehydrogenase small subunit (CoxS/CutS family)
MLRARIDDGDTRKFVSAGKTRRLESLLNYVMPPLIIDWLASDQQDQRGTIARQLRVLTRFHSGITSALAQDRPAGAVERLISINVNGQIRRVDVLPQETLAYTLRYKLGLIGTKIGCNRGECGACTVVIDGVTHYSCSTLTHSVRAQSVLTVEGLQGADGRLHPVQQAFIDELSPQCGFCTPGQVMAAVALLEENPTPTREEARQALSGNLCRCGAYDHYLNGVMRAAGQNS